MGGNICKDIQATWEEFSAEIDDTTDLGRKQGTEITLTEKTSDIRTVTLERKQGGQHLKIRADITDPEDVKVKPEETYLPCYTYQDISELQRQDADLMHLHDWIDQRVTPKREDVAG